MDTKRALGKISIILVVLVAMSVWAKAQPDDDVCKDLSRLMEIQHGAIENKPGFRVNTLTANYDVKYHRLEWSVNPAQNYIAGSVTTYFVPTDNGFDHINFDFADNMQVNAVTYHGETLSHAFTGPYNLEIALPAGIEAGKLDSVSIDYEGAPESIGFGSFEQSTHEGVPVLWTLSEPYGAKTWWPCKQNLSDKVDSIDVIVRTPAQYRVASNGLLVDEMVDDTMKVFHWRHRYPVPAYLVAIGVTNYDVFSDFVELESGDTLEILNYIYPEALAEAEPLLKTTVDVMILFDSLFGKYPFAEEKYGHAQFGFSGGMEHQTMSFMGKFTFKLQAHELAHQWFGDKVTCGSWHEIWLNEGFATYLTGLAREFLQTEADFFNWKRDRVIHITSHTGGSVWVSDTTNVLRVFDSRLSYSKGAMLLHMLRWKLGDDVFFRAIRNYINAPELEYDYAYTNDLQFYLEQESETDLTEFFDDWFYGKGYPSYHLSWSQKDESIRMTLLQSTSHPSVEFYEMPVPVYMAGQGRDTIVRLEHEFDGQEFEFEVPFIVDSVSVDPDYWLISAGNTVENLPVGIRGVDNQQASLSINPNPFTEALVIQIDCPGKYILGVAVTNSNGVFLRQFQLNDNRVELESGSWPGGTYFITCELNDGTTVTKKVIKGAP